MILLFCVFCIANTWCVCWKCQTCETMFITITQCTPLLIAQHEYVMLQYVCKFQMQGKREFPDGVVGSGDVLSHLSKFIFSKVDKRFIQIVSLIITELFER